MSAPSTYRRPVAPARPGPATDTRLRVAPNALLAAIGIGAAAVIALWWQDTLTVSGLGGWLTNAGRITGLLSGYAVVVLLGLMARVPAVERGVGADRLARWHAMGGRYTVSLAVAHTLLIIWGYAVTAHTSLTSQTATLLTGYPDVLMATVALGLFLLVGVTSARAARRRLQYETWHLVHLYTYLAIALAFSHQFATGTDFRTDPRARWLWALFYVVVAAALLWYRVMTPLVAFRRHAMRVASVVPEGPDTVSVSIVGRDLDRLQAESGQFFRWRFLAPELWWAANPYSLSAAPHPQVLRITVKVAGRHSDALRQLRPGTRVLAEGPYGAMTARLRRRRKVLLIGAGIGITPLRALAETLPAAPGDVTIIHRASTKPDLVLAPELQTLAHARGFRLHHVVGRRGRDERSDPLSRRRLTALVPDLAEHDVYLCGPDALTADLTRTLRSAGVPRDRIHHESFAL